MNYVMCLTSNHFRQKIKFSLLIFFFLEGGWFWTLYKAKQNFLSVMLKIQNEVKFYFNFNFLFTFHHKVMCSFSHTWIIIYVCSVFIIFHELKTRWCIQRLRENFPLLIFYFFTGRSLRIPNWEICKRKVNKKRKIHMI